MLKIFILLVSSLFTNNVFAQQCDKLDCVIDQLVPHITGLDGIMVGIAFLCGIGLTIKGILKLRDMSESKGQIKLSSALILILAGALLIALPQTIKVGKETLSLTGSNNSGATY